MNLGLGQDQMVEFSPAFPYHGAFFLRTQFGGIIRGTPAQPVRTDYSRLCRSDRTSFGKPRGAGETPVMDRVERPEAN